jgi:hypothetical protein
MAEPRQRRVLVDRADHRDHDRREQDEEAPEDRRMDDAGDEALEQLPLAEHDDRLIPDPLARVAEAIDRLAEPDQIDEQLGAPGEEEAADREESGERQRSGGDVYETRAFLSSAVIAGTTSARSPMTA